jgi:hypothetical protein
MDDSQTGGSRAASAQNLTALEAPCNNYKFNRKLQFLNSSPDTVKWKGGRKSEEPCQLHASLHQAAGIDLRED